MFNFRSQASIISRAVQILLNIYFHLLKTFYLFISFYELHLSISVRSGYISIERSFRKERKKNPQIQTNEPFVINTKNA